jgi:hypothetical protein
MRYKPSKESQSSISWFRLLQLTIAIPERATNHNSISVKMLNAKYRGLNRDYGPFGHLLSLLFFARIRLFTEPILEKELPVDQLWD